MSDDIITQLIKKYNIRLTFPKKEEKVKTRPADRVIKRRRRKKMRKKDDIVSSHTGNPGSYSCSICGNTAPVYYRINSRDGRGVYGDVVLCKDC